MRAVQHAGIFDLLCNPSSFAATCHVNVPNASPAAPSLFHRAGRRLPGGARSAARRTGRPISTCDWPFVAAEAKRRRNRTFYEEIWL